MLVLFVYNASSCEIFNREDRSIPGYEKQELGRCIIDLDPTHLSRELRWVQRKLRRLGYTDAQTHQKVVEKVAHGLRAKEHFYIEL